MTSVKICGLTKESELNCVNKALPEYAGFVFWDKSRRNLSFEQAAKLREGLDKKIRTVGVFVDRNIDDIVYLVENDIISCVQLHGSEGDDTILELRRRLPEGTLIIKAFEVKDAQSAAKANLSKADMVLIDSGKGSGNTFDWNLLKQVNRDYFLAGGLSEENVSEAVKTLHPYGVDVSSKVEIDGHKDSDKVIRFCQLAREI